MLSSLWEKASRRAVTDPFHRWVDQGKTCISRTRDEDRVGERGRKEVVGGSCLRSAAESN